MKRFAVVLGVVMLLIGIRLYDTGAYRFFKGQALSVYSYQVNPQIFLPNAADSYRIDLDSDISANTVLRRLSARVAFKEMDGALIYAYSPLIPQTEWIHGSRVNVMIYSSDEATVIGIPVIKGSY